MPPRKFTVNIVTNSTVAISENGEQAANVVMSDNSGYPVGFQISEDVAAINLSNGYVDEEGFYICVDPAGTEGLLYVILYGQATETPKAVPFFLGWNPVFVRAVTVNAGNTAASVYYGK